MLRFILPFRASTFSFGCLHTYVLSYPLRMILEELLLIGERLASWLQIPTGHTQNTQVANYRPLVSSTLELKPCRSSRVSHRPTKP